MDRKKPFEEKEDEKPLVPEIYMDQNQTVLENDETNIKYSNRMLF